jgi:hypothetical protein
MKRERFPIRIPHVRPSFDEVLATMGAWLETPEGAKALADALARIPKREDRRPPLPAPSCPGMVFG